MSLRMIILGTVLILCSCMSQAAFSHRALASITTQPTSNVEPLLPTGPCQIAFQAATKTFVTGGKIFTNIYMKKVGDGVCKEADRPYVYALYYTPDGKPLPSSLQNMQELGQGSSPAKWGTIFNSIQSECTGLCQKYCADPDAEIQCHAEIVIFKTLPEKVQPLPGGLPFGGLFGKIPPYSLKLPVPQSCAEAGLDPLKVSLEFYETLGDRRKKVMNNPVIMDSKWLPCSLTIELPMK